MNKQKRPIPKMGPSPQFLQITLMLILLYLNCQHIKFKRTIGLNTWMQKEIICSCWRITGTISHHLQVTLQIDLLTAFPKEQKKQTQRRHYFKTQLGSQQHICALIWKEQNEKRCIADSLFLIQQIVSVRHATCTLRMVVSVLLQK